MVEDTKHITQLLIRYTAGDQNALQNLLPAVYQELKKIAMSHMRKENQSHTLQATALVHEAYFRLIDQDQMKWENRAQFFGIASQLMRRILVDHARAKHAAKRGGTMHALSFDENIHQAIDEDTGPDLLAIDRALEKLTELNARQAKVVELKYFGGLSIEEIAQILDTSPATVKRDWMTAKAWLYRELANESV